MEIAEISQNDSLPSVIRKCNLNFRQLAWNIRQSVRKQSRIDSQGTDAAIVEITNQIAELENVTIPSVVGSAVSAAVPSEVASQITAADIPQMVSNEVAAQAVVPPVGSYLLTQSDPSAIYDGTTWQQSDTVGTTGGAQIPLWERTA
jgi:hypothetical protein